MLYHTRGNFLENVKLNSKVVTLLVTFIIKKKKTTSKLYNKIWSIIAEPVKIRI